jgi:hypothetical protein
MKRRWDDDVVFKNQARGSEVKRGPEFVNVSLPLGCKECVLIFFRISCDRTFINDLW